MGDRNENPTITEPLEEWAEKLIDRALLKHEARCPVVGRVQRLEVRFAALLGYMVGSGLVGGVLGAGLIRLIFG